MSTERLTEILNYLSATSREIGEFRSEMKSRLGGLETRVERVESGMGARFEAMNVKFDEFRSDVRRMTKKFDVLAEDMIELRADYHNHEKRIDTLERKTGITDTV